MSVFNDEGYLASCLTFRVVVGLNSPYYFRKSKLQTHNSKKSSKIEETVESMFCAAFLSKKLIC